MELMFEQQRRESDKAYAAFKTYLNDGPERSLGSLAVKLGKAKRLVEMWSSRWNWQARLEAYREHMALVERKAAEALVRDKAVDWAKCYDELRRAEWEERTRLLEFAAEVRRRWMAAGLKCGTLEGYARLLELASTLGGRACEAATERKEISGPEGGPIRVEVEAALKKIYGQPLPGEVAAPPAYTDGHQAPPAYVDVEAVQDGSDGRLQISDSAAGNGVPALPRGTQ
jgi:hypothetical protein